MRKTKEYLGAMVFEVGKRHFHLAIMQDTLINNGEDAIGATSCEFSS